MSDEHRLEDLLLIWEELKEQARELAPEELCRGCPELLQELRESIGALEQMAWLDEELVGTGHASPHCRPRASLRTPTAPYTDETTNRSGADSPGQPTTPAVLGDYLVREPIGVGGMGRVFKAVHCHMQRVVALKIIRDDAVASTDAIARFQREVKAAAKLDHPNIVTAHDAGEDSGVFYLVMEYVDGQDLYRKVKEHGPLPAEEAIGYIIQAARGLEHAHEQGITHRDIKPANLILGPDGNVKVLDMGLARFREGGVPEEGDSPTASSTSDTVRNVNLTQTGTIHGTVGYMAPEQRTSTKSSADHRADIYGLGCTLYYLLTGTTLHGPHPGADPALQKDLTALLRRQRTEVPPAMAAVLRKMTAPQPEDRHQSMSEVIASLKATLGEDRGPASRLGRLLRSPKLLAWGGAVMLLLVVWMGYETHGLLQAISLEQRLLNCATPDAPSIVEQLARYRRWAEPRLRKAYAQALVNQDERTELHASLALAASDAHQRDNLCRRMLSANVNDLPVIRDALYAHRAELTEALWALVRNAEEDRGTRIRAACALASYVPGDVRWNQVSGELAASLLEEPAGMAARWIECLRPVRDYLKSPLSSMFRHNDEDGGPQRIASARALAHLFADQPELLANLLMDADQEQFAELFGRLNAHRAAAATFEAQLTKRLPPGNDAKEILAKRQANAGAALIRLGMANKVWSLLKDSPDRSVRSWLVGRMGPLGADPAALAERLRDERDTAVRRALILSLGGFAADQLDDPGIDSLVSQLLALFRDDPDPGIHGAVDWLLRRWKQDEKLEGLRLPTSSSGERQWYLNGEGQTMIVVPGPVEFLMGSPPSEPGALPQETLHRRSIARTFAIGAKEVTIKEFQRFLRDNPQLRRTETSDPSEGPNHPQNHVTWQETIAYCRWLSQREGIEEDQMCYPPVSADTSRLNLPEDYLDRRGYRLPTEAEWEYACRAGSRTSRFFGDSEDLLDEYGWNSREKAFTSTRPVEIRPAKRTQPVGTLKPNDFGLFDTYGNVLEWCHHTLDEVGSDGVAEAGGSAVESLLARLRLRGGSHRNRKDAARSASRFRHRPGMRTATLGFRVARTLPTTSFGIVQRHPAAWGKAEFLVYGPAVPFIVRDVRGGVEVSSSRESAPALVSVSAPDHKVRPFSFAVERVDTHEIIPVSSVLLWADWTVEFYGGTPHGGAVNLSPAWPQEKVAAGTPLAVEKVAPEDLDRRWRALAEGATHDDCTLVATTKIELPAGKYELWAKTDDGVRVFVDGVKRMEFNAHLPLPGTTSNLVEVEMDSGEHSFRLEHCEVNGPAKLHFGIWRLK